MSTALIQLTQQFDLHVDKLGKAITEFKFEDREIYGGWLSQTYFFVRHTTRLLTIAASRAPVDDRALHYDMIHHLQGELNHDEVARKDIEGLGFDISDFRELNETAMMYQSQYYWLERTKVSSMMGYALLLEGLAAKYGAVMIKKSKPHGPEATEFIRLHADVDVGHYAAGLQSLALYPTSEHADILKNMEQSSQMYRQMLLYVGQGKALASSPLAA